MRGRTAAFVVVALVAVAGAIFYLLPRGGTSKEVLVLCGASMRAPMEQIVERYKRTCGDTILMSYGDSGELCAQIQRTRTGDIFICHDPFMGWAADQGLVETWRTVGRLEQVIVVPKGNPKGIKRLEDLAQPGLRVGVGDQRYSTAGIMFKNMMERLPQADAIQKNVVAETKGHQERCTDVALGALDAALVWNPVARVNRDKLDTIEIPQDYADAVTSATYKKSDLRNVKVTIGVIGYSRNKERARRFFEFATTEGKDVFCDCGFAPAKE
jgi:molybdate transport system substrate-binding protein